MEDINKINELVASKKFDEAKILIEENINNETKNVEFLKLAGLTFVNLEEWSKAKNIFEAVIKYEKNSLDFT